MNLTALPSRFTRIWRRRVTSPRQWAGAPGAIDARQFQPGRHRRGADEVERRFDALAQRERHRLDLQAPGLDLREVEDVVDDRQQRIAAAPDGVDVVALLGVERRVEQQRRHPDHAVHRRADLVADRGEKLRLGAGGAFGAVLGALQRLDDAAALGHVVQHDQPPDRSPPAIAQLRDLGLVGARVGPRADVDRRRPARRRPSERVEQRRVRRERRRWRARR